MGHWSERPCLDGRVIRGRGKLEVSGRYADAPDGLVVRLKRLSHQNRQLHL